MIKGGTVKPFERFQPCTLGDGLRVDFGDKGLISVSQGKTFRGSRGARNHKASVPLEPLVGIDFVVKRFVFCDFFENVLVCHSVRCSDFDML